MLRRLIVPIFLILVVAGVGSMCTALTGARAKRQLEQRALAPTPSTTPASPKVDSAATRVIACPEKLADTTGWTRVAPEGSRISILIPPDFQVVSQSGSPDPNPPFLAARAVNGDEYHLTNRTRPIQASDFLDYKSTTTCRIMIGFLVADLETARDSWRGGDHNVVLASYDLGVMKYITVLGTTESVEHQRQIVTALHYVKFRAQ
jgi:hypothetical protein